MSSNVFCAIPVNTAATLPGGEFESLVVLRRMKMPDPSLEPQPQPTSLEERKSPLPATMVNQGTDAVQLSGVS